MNYAKGIFLKVKKTIFSAEEDINAPPFISAADCNACAAPCTEQDHPHYPSFLKINQDMPLLYSVKPYTRHVLISTGKEDWDAHIEDDKTSLAHHLSKAIDAAGQSWLPPSSGRILLTNSSRLAETWDGPGWQVLVLPDRILVENVTIDQCDDFVEAFLKTPYQPSSTRSKKEKEGSGGGVAVNEEKTSVSKEGEEEEEVFKEDVRVEPLSLSVAASALATTTIEASTSPTEASTATTITTITTTTTPAETSAATYHLPDDSSRTVRVGQSDFVVQEWKPKAAIMICSHKKRDKRCGVTAPILGKEFKRILRAKDLYGTLEGDVEIWMISHIGGHKFAGNVIVHMNEGMAVWYGRVEPCHAQAIVDATVERGEIIRELYRGCMKGSFERYTQQQQQQQQKQQLAW
ncbi:hypothetical protein BG004_005137 [Podila humilis]|nr:hypothetical protein BG004_005137 [Podila humilis]